MLKRLVSYHAWLLLAVSAGFPVAAQQHSPDHMRCMNEASSFSPDAQIGCCTAVLQSGRETAANRAVAYNNRGFAYANKKDFDRAIADYNEAIKLDPRYAGAYVNRGVAHGEKRDLDRAVADFTEAIRLKP